MAIGTLEIIEPAMDIDSIGSKRENIEAIYDPQSLTQPEYYERVDMELQAAAERALTQIDRPSLTVLHRDPDWSKSKCQTGDSDRGEFYPDQSDAALAKRLCKGCSIIDQCLEFALANDEVGIWGGKSDIQRTNIRKQRLLEGAIASYCLS